MSHTVILGATQAAPTAPAVVLAPPSHGAAVLSSNRGSVFLQGDVEAMLGWEGLGPPQRRANRSRPLGRDGSIRNRRRPTQRGERELVMPCHVAGATPYARAELMDRVIDICSPLDDSEVTLTMTRRGETVSCSGDMLFDGGSEFMAEAAYDRVALVQLRMTCPDPNFYGAQRTARQVDPDGGAFFPIGPVVLSDSTGFGAPLVVNTGGTRKTFAEFRILGPLTRLRATSSLGATWELDLAGDPLLGGERVTVRSDPASGLEGLRRVEGPGGASYWRHMTDKAFFPFLPGRDTVTFDLDGQTPDTEVEVAWRPAFEAVS